MIYIYGEIFNLEYIQSYLLENTTYFSNRPILEKYEHIFKDIPVVYSSVYTAFLLFKILVFFIPMSESLRVVLQLQNPNMVSIKKWNPNPNL